MKNISFSDGEREEVGMAIDARITVLTGMHTKCMKEKQMEAAKLLKDKIDMLATLRSKMGI